MTKRQLAAAEARHAQGLRWYDGPELLVSELNGAWLGIGTRDELDALKADGILDSSASYRPVTPQDVA
ncbi:MAG TPA: hypothetical protein VGB48_09900 [Allosphingosinicella sp.]